MTFASVSLFLFSFSLLLFWVWSQKEKFEQSAFYQSVERNIKLGIRQINQSENPLIKSAVDLKKQTIASIEDARENYETSQDPSVRRFVCQC